MKNQQKKFFAISVFTFLLLAGSVFAQRLYTTNVSLGVTGKPDVKVTLAGTVTRNNQMLNVEKAGALNPGEILHWTITSQNAGSAPAQNYKTVGEVPTGTSYVAGSAQAEGNVQVLFSIDGGKTFEAKPMIEQKQPDGSVKKIAAPASLYTQVRYEWNDPLSAGKQLSASYKVRVK